MWGLCAHILFYPLWTISHKVISHMHKQQSMLWVAGFWPPDGAAETVREAHPETQRSLSELDFVSEQSRTTQESVASECVEAAACAQSRHRLGSAGPSMLGRGLGGGSITLPTTPPSLFYWVHFFFIELAKRGLFCQLHRRCNLEEQHYKKQTNKQPPHVCLILGLFYKY